jgi:hypothetical protein
MLARMGLVALVLVVATCQGDDGPTGPAGPQGPVGPSAAYETYVNNFVNVTTTQTQLAQLNLPAGTFIIWAKGLLNSNDAALTQFNCRLTAGAAEDGNSVGGEAISMGTQAGDEREYVTLMLPHTFAAAGTATFTCASTGSGNVIGPRLVAVQVQNITTQ